MPNGPDLNEDFVAFKTAQSDLDFTLFKVYTRALNSTDGVGQFELPAKYPLHLFEAYPDPVGLLKNIARTYISHCCASTKVPIEKWIIEFSPIMERYQIPSHLYLDTARDRAWLL